MSAPSASPPVSPRAGAPGAPDHDATDDDGRLHFPATERNREAILTVLEQVFPPEGTVLEIASGSGQHASWFAGHHPAWRWAPTDLDPAGLRSIDAWARASGVTSVLPARALDVTARPWPIEDLAPVDAVLCCNMIHIAPWACTEALLAGAGQALRPGGVLALYGPFKRGGRHTAPSNARFDDSLRGRDPAWGVRDLDEVTALAERAGLHRVQVVEMPANNLTVVFRRDG